MYDLYYTPPVTGFVYGLFDSREPDVLVYIGQTRDTPIMRLKGHLLPGRQVVCLWVSDVLHSGGRVGMRVLEECPLSSLNRRERHWIKHYGKTCVLLNIQFCHGTRRAAMRALEKLRSSKMGHR